MKLDGGAKAIIRNIVGWIHVAMMKAVCIEALKQHAANYREYVAVTRGVF